MNVVLKTLFIFVLGAVAYDILVSFPLFKLCMLLASVVILGFCFFSLRRSDETKELLQEGIGKSLNSLETEEGTIDLKRFGRHMRYIAGALSFLSLLYWLTVRAYVSIALGLTGALLVFAEFVLNFEVVYFLTSNPRACLSESGASQVISVYRVLAISHMAAIVGVIGNIIT